MPVFMDPHSIFPMSFDPMQKHDLPDGSGPAPRRSQSKCTPMYYFYCLHFAYLKDADQIAQPPISSTEQHLFASIPMLVAQDVRNASCFIGHRNIVRVL